MNLLVGCLQDAKALGYRQLAVSGGEPLLYSELDALLANARDLGMLTTLTSNGMLVTAEKWERLAPLLDLVAISVDGTPDEHDAIRRHKGAFACMKANLEIIRYSRVPFGFIFTLTQYNVNSLEFVVRLAAEQGALSVQVHPLTLHGRAAKTLGDARPDGVEMVAALIEAARLGNELGIHVHVDTVTAEQLAQYRDHLVPATPIRQLTDAAPILIVKADASVIPLTHELSETFQLGSLKTTSLASLAQAWMASGQGDRLADVCERTWMELTQMWQPLACYWYDEVAARS